MKKIVYWLGILSVVLGLGYYFGWVVQCKPKGAVWTAQEFFTRVASKNWKAAYDLTIQRDPMGKDLNEFESIVKYQLGEPPFKSIQTNGAFPFQSYGNRLRRRLSGQQVEMPQISFLFHVDGHPFEVRETYIGNNNWRIKYIQSHAE